MNQARVIDKHGDLVQTEILTLNDDVMAYGKKPSQSRYDQITRGRTEKTTET